jgi:hypothetical protein
MSSAFMGAALRGDEEFLKAIDAADPDTFGISCSGCETYYVGKWSECQPTDVCCPVCNNTRGSMESPGGDSAHKAKLIAQKE